MLRLFRQPTAAELAAKQLAEAERDALAAKRLRDFYQGLSDANDATATRLREYLKGTTQ